MAKYVGAIDQGTTSTRFMIFDHAGEVVAVDQKEHEQIYPQPGWVEHDPIEILERTGEVIRGAMQKASITAADLAAIGITNQRETTIAWDRRDGKPLCNAIVWQDTRTDRIVNRLAADGGQGRFRKKTGLPLATYFAGPKLMWMMENVDGVREAFEGGYGRVGTVDTWLIWNLTGGPDGGQHITDPTNASRTMLMDLKTLDWDDDILAVMGLPRAILPGIRPSSDPNFYGMTRADGPVGGEVPICGDLGDQQAALVGQACYEVGDGKNTYGTGCFMLLNTGHEIVQSANGLITTVGYQFGDEKPVYALEGSIAIAGALVQWLRDNLGLIKTAPEVEDVAASVDGNGGMYIVPAFSGLFAPYWRSDARGVMVGLTRYINRGHIARAALESTAYQTREVAEAMASDSGVPLTSLKVDGGMVVNELLMQFQSDILGVPVVRPRINETTALGAAYAAGLAVGFWASVDEVREKWEASKRWEPAMDGAERKQLYDGWLKAVTRTFDWVEDADE